MRNGQRVPEEVYYHSRVKHPAIIELLGHFWDDDSFVMVMEKPEEPCDLADYLIEYGVLEEDEGREIFRQVTGAAHGAGGGEGGGRGPQGVGERSELGGGSVGDGLVGPPL